MPATGTEHIHYNSEEKRQIFPSCRNYIPNNLVCAELVSSYFEVVITKHCIIMI